MVAGEKSQPLRLNDSLVLYLKNNFQLTFLLSFYIFLNSNRLMLFFLFLNNRFGFLMEVWRMC